MLHLLISAQTFFLQFILVPTLILVGLWISVSLRWIHLRNLGTAINCLFKPSPKKSAKNMSSFSAFAAILGGNLGVGNLSGTAIALAIGGPGSIIWMVLIIFITCSVKYSTCYLSITYRIKNNSRFVGGPMYFLKDGLGSNISSVCFCIATVMTAVIGGGLVQVNSLALPMDYLEIPRIYGGLLFAGVIALVTVRNMHFFSKVVNFVVPFMAVAYLILVVCILTLYSDRIIPSIILMFESVFTFRDAKGAIVWFLWSQFFTTMQFGVSRGIFASDIGFGLEGILHSNVKHEEGHKLPLEVEQGLISVISPFIVLVVCFITALMLMVTGVYQSSLESTNMCFEALRIGFGSDVPGYFLIVLLFCFAFTTVLTWSFCAQCCLEYITNYNKGAILFWKAFLIVILPFGAVSEVYVLWKMADFTAGLMLLTNLLGMIFLSREVIRGTRKAFGDEKQ